MHTPLVISRSVTIPIDFPSSSTTSSELTFLSNIFLAASLAFCDVRIISILVVIISLTCFDTAVCNARVLYILILHRSPTLARFLFGEIKKEDLFTLYLSQFRFKSNCGAFRLQIYLNGSRTSQFIIYNVFCLRSLLNIYESCNFL